jgi:hypothetical protein
MILLVKERWDDHVGWAGVDKIYDFVMSRISYKNTQINPNPDYYFERM